MLRKNILPIAEVVDNKDRRKIWLRIHILAPKGIRFIPWYNGKKYPLLKNTALIIFETISTTFSICGILTNENSKFIFSFETRE
jgi:hypothetical protein